MVRAMERLNLTLDPETMKTLRALARTEKTGIAEATRRLIQEAIRRRKRLELERRMAADHLAGANDPEERELVAEATAAADELMARMAKEEE